MTDAEPQKAPAAPAPTATITSPVSGGAFAGSAGGGFTPIGTSGVTVEFWQFGPPGPGTPPDRTAAATLGRLVWNALLNVTGLTTTTGFLRATNNDGGMPAEVANLEVT